MYTIKNLKKLRQETGVSFILCKKALEEANDNIKKAKEILKKNSQISFEAKKRKKTENGAIFSYVHHNQRIAVLVELFCQTDFVAKNLEFQKLGNDLAKQIASMDPKNKKELLNQPFIKNQSETVASLIKQYILKLGENIKIGKFVRYEI